MIDSLIGACETLVSAVSGNGKHPSSRISRAGMPNGLLGILGEEFALQVQWSIDSDYRHELETYHRETLNLRRQDPVHGQFGARGGSEKRLGKLQDQPGKLMRLTDNNKQCSAVINNGSNIEG